MISWRLGLKLLNRRRWRGVNVWSSRERTSPHQPRLFLTLSSVTTVLSAVIDLFIPLCTSLDLSSDKLHLSILPTVDTASILGEVSRLVPGFLAKQDVICLDSSGDEEEKVEPKLPALDIRDGKMFETLTPLWSTLISDFFNSVRS